MMVIRDALTGMLVGDQAVDNNDNLARVWVAEDFFNFMATRYLIDLSDESLANS